MTRLIQGHNKMQNTRQLVGSNFKLWVRTRTLLLCSLLAHPAFAQDDRGYKVYQFPANMIPRIDGKADDWASFPKEYAVGTDQLRDDSGHYPRPDTANLKVSVKVAWVEGLNRL